MRIADTPRDAFCSVEDFRGTLARPSARRRHRRGFDREGTGNAIRIAGIEREEQLRRLEVRAGDEIDQTEADRRAPAGVDATQIGFGDLAGLALFEFQPTRAKLRAPHQQSRKRTPRSARHLETDRLQHRTHGFLQPVDGVDGRTIALMLEYRLGATLPDDARVIRAVVLVGQTARQIAGAGDGL